MDRPDDPIVRAFQLASSGVCAGLSDIRMQLKSEGYNLATMNSTSLAKQLHSLIKKSKAPRD